MKNSLLLFVLLYLIAPVAQAQTLILDEVKKKMLSGFWLESEVKFLILDSFTLERHESKGAITIATDAYKVEADGRVILVDGATSIVYTAAQKQVIISKYNAEEDDYAPSRFLTGITSDYVLKDQKTQRGNTIVTLTASTPFALFKQVELTIETKTLLPVKFVAVDQTDNINETWFSKARYITGKDKQLSLVYPEETEIIDLRK